MLSEFSATAGDLAGRLEDLAAGAQLDKAASTLEQLEAIAQELVKQMDGITVETLRPSSHRHGRTRRDSRSLACPSQRVLSTSG